MSSFFKAPEGVERIVEDIEHSNMGVLQETRQQEADDGTLVCLKQSCKM